MFTQLFSFWWLLPGPLSVDNFTYLLSHTKPMQRELWTQGVQ